MDRSTAAGVAAVMAAPRAWLLALAIAIPAPTAIASQPPQRSVEDYWQELIASVAPELARCGERAIAAGVYGDVRVQLDPRRRCTASPSHSLGAHGAEIAACVQRAIADRLSGTALGSPREVEIPADGLVHVERVGTPAMILPAPGALLPGWRQAVAGGLDRRAAAQALAAVLPPDYAVSRELCLVTDREAAHDTEDRWLSAVGPRVAGLWRSAISEVLHDSVGSAVWVGGVGGGAVVTSSARGLCLVPFGPDRQAAMRARFDAAGSCWVGDFAEILLRPRIELPADRRYRAVSVRNRRVCALGTRDELVCCGAVPALPPLPPVRSIALGNAFACGLDDRDEIRCRGEIAAPPPGAFRAVRAGSSYACGLRGDGRAECWGKPPYQIGQVPQPPAHGQYVDLAIESDACGLRPDGSAECWAPTGFERQPPGQFRSLAINEYVACGVRGDATVGCWGRSGDPVDTPTPERVVEVVVGGPYRLCGRRLDGTVACFTSHRPGDPQPPQLRAGPPPGRFEQIAAHGDTFCGVRADGDVTCWGDPWPGEIDRRPPVAELPPATSDRTLTGRVVDETGRPIAGAEVLACSGPWPCASASRDGAWVAATLADQLARQPVSGRPGTTALATTGGDGRWTARIASSPDSSRVTAVITAPHREIVERIADPYDPSGLRGDTALRPASSLDIDARCVFAPCTGTIDAAFTHHGRDPDARWLGAARPGTHIARLAPGSYTVVVRENRDEAGERRGEAVVEVPFAPAALRVLVVLVPVGTGRSIRGIAVPDSADPQDVTVSCRSSHEGETVRRHARADRAGRFELTDVGAPPCDLAVEPVRSRGHERRRVLRLDRLPAGDVVVPAR